MKRNESIECYRIFLMFCICLIHSVALSEKCYEPLRNVLATSVVGFAYISGWFGINACPSKFFKLFGVGLYATMICAMLTWMFREWFGLPVHYQLNLFRDCWFYSSYCTLMVVSPLLNWIAESLKDVDEKKHAHGVMLASLILSAVFVYGFAVSMRYVPGGVAAKIFLGPFGGASLIGAYLVARIVRVLDVYDRLGTPFVIFLFMIGISATACGLGLYNSPTSLLVVFSSFYFVIKMRCPTWLGVCALFGGPSMFSIYLFHSHKRLGFVVMKEFQNWIVESGSGVLVGWLLTALVVFAAGLCLDLIRRFMVVLANDLLHAFYKFCDEKWYRMTEYVR